MLTVNNLEVSFKYFLNVIRFTLGSWDFKALNCMHLLSECFILVEPLLSVTKSSETKMMFEAEVIFLKLSIVSNPIFDTDLDCFSNGHSVHFGAN